MTPRIAGDKPPLMQSRRKLKSAQKLSKTARSFNKSNKSLPSLAIQTPRTFRQFSARPRPKSARFDPIIVAKVV